MKFGHKRTLLLLLVGASLSFVSRAAFAQPDPRRTIPDSSQIAQMMDSLARRLLLTDSLKTKVSKFYYASFKELSQELDRSAGNFQAGQKAARQIMQTRDQQVKDLLSDRQKKEYDKFLQEQRERFRQQMKARRGRSRK